MSRASHGSPDFGKKQLELSAHFPRQQPSIPMKNRAFVPKLLLVDDDRHLVDSMGQWLGTQGFQVVTSTGIQEALVRLSQQSFELVLIDVRLADGDGFELLRKCVADFPATTPVLMTGYATVEMSIEALRAGAFDLLTKPIIDEELLMSLRRAISQREVVRENKQLKAELDRRFGLDHIVGDCLQMKRIFEIVDSVAETRATILITGESGTGKSLIARAIHKRSNRSHQPFVEIACGALPENLLESELFGHMAGAFTGATTAKDGKFKVADGGTIFLDEIATATPALQVKLLRVLQELQFEPVGGNKTITIDTRVILATNEDLAECVTAGKFRQDLYYRINVINLELPPLRHRVSDIPALAERFLRNVTRDTGRRIDGFESSALEALQQHAWPGNVRELQNVIERAVLLGKGPRISLADLPPAFATPDPTAQAVYHGQQTLKEALAGPERHIILQVLRSNDWNRNATADQLGINRTTLYKKMKRLGLEACDPALSKDS